MVQTRFRLLLAAAGVACAVMASGCGLEEYERRLAEQQLRRDYLEKESSHLDGTPIQIRPIEKKGADSKDQDFHADNFFVRPPHGISSATDEKLVYGFMYRCPGRGETSPFKEMLVAAVKSPNRDKFRDEVLRKMGMSKTAQSRQVASRLGRTTEFEYYREERANETLRAYFSLGDSLFHLAIVFRLKPGSTADVETKIAYFLAAVAVGAEGFRAHDLHKATRGRR